MGLVSTESIEKCSLAVLIKMGVPESDAQIITDSILYAHLRGKHTHGIGRMPIYNRKIIENLMNPETPVEILKDTPAVSVIDANNGFGQVAAIRAMDMCIEKASKLGIGLVGVKDSNNFGTAGFIGEHAANAGMIGIILANSGPAIAPQGGSKAIFGTNPVCISFPAVGGYAPIIFDMACSNAARGKIRLAAKSGEEIPLGWALGPDGNETRDPNEALKGTMIPIGGYKGYGIAMCVDILAGMMTGSGYGGSVKNLNHPTEISHYGHMILAINPEFFMERAEFEESLITLIENTKACGEPGKVYLPGERSYFEVKKNKTAIELKDNLIHEMNELADQLGAGEKLITF